MNEPLGLGCMMEASFPIDWILPLGKSSQSDPGCANIASPTGLAARTYEASRESNPIAGISQDRIKFRAVVCIRMFKIASWYEKLGRTGVRCESERFIDPQAMTAATVGDEASKDNINATPIDRRGVSLCNSRLMCEDERAEYARRAIEKRVEARDFTARWMGLSKIKTIEAMAGHRDLLLAPSSRAQITSRTNATILVQ